MNGVNRLHILQLTHVWPGLILVAPFAPLMARSRWWVIPVAIGFARLFIDVLKMQRIIRADLDEAERRAREAEPKGG